MKSFDPDFSNLSNEQLAEIDSLCSKYEATRTQGGDITIEAFLVESELEIQTQLKRELLQIEMEILETWDQLGSLKAMIDRFPEEEVLIREQWESLQQRTGPKLANPLNRETQANTVPRGSTHDEGRKTQTIQQSEDESPVPHDPSLRFRIIRNLAHGGIGTVFVAFDSDLQREVAIKVLKRKFANDRVVTQRFEAEATVTGNLEHPNIIPIYATGIRSDGRPFYAMRLIHGRSMQAAISDLHNQHAEDLDFRGNPVARDLMLRFITVCRAVGFAHSRGVLHRDLKPSNIMVGDFGETLVVDWGLARAVHSIDSKQMQSRRRGQVDRLNSDKTLDGTIVGTPGYMSPEQAFGRNEEITRASDIYSLGATLFQILTNQIPHMHTGNASPAPQCDTEAYIATRSKNGSPVALSKFGDFPAALNAICGQAMEFDPKKRYSSAELLATDLEAWLLDEPVSVLPETRLQKIRRWAKSHPAMVAGGLASLLFTLLAMGITLSILSIKNESLRQSNLREQTAALESANNAAIAKRNGDEAVRQRERVLGILKTFLVDVERGLTNVPGGAAVQRNVLTTVLNKLGEVSGEFSSDDDISQSNAMALVDLGDLFSRVGTKEIQLDLPQWNEIPLSPLEAADLMYTEAMKIAKSVENEEGQDARSLIAMILQKQAEVLRQTARTPEALALLDESLRIRRQLLSESPESVEPAMGVVLALDYRGTIYFQDGDFSNARDAFRETESILTRLAKASPKDFDIKRRLSVSLSRIADIALKDGDLDLATNLYDQDLAITTELYQSRPDNLTAKRDVCTSLDRLGNMHVNRGLLEKAMEPYLESRRLREELREAEPTNSKAISELLVSYMKCGDTRMLMKEVAAAQSDYKKALLLADEFARIDPQNVNARRFQSMSAEVLADVAIAEMQLDDALQYAQKSLVISQELLLKDPTSGQMQQDLVICYLKVAKVYLAKEDYNDCHKQLDLALDIARTSYENMPDSVQAFGTYSFVLLKRAEALLKAGDALLASKELEIIIPLLESVSESNRQDATSRRRIANAYTLLGRSLLLQKEYKKARDLLDRARQLTNAMIEEGMRLEQMKIDLAEIDQLIGSLDAE
jgi:eukaryotic-like serine/threonine-protein kinase